MLENPPEEYVLSPEKSEEFHRWRLRSTLRTYLAHAATLFTGYTAIHYFSQQDWSEGTIVGLAAIVCLDMGRIQRRIDFEELGEILKR